MKRNIYCAEFPVYPLFCHWLQEFRLSFVCLGFIRTSWLRPVTHPPVKEVETGEKKLTHVNSWSESWRQTPMVISHLLYLDFYDSIQFYFALSYLHTHTYMCLCIVLRAHIYIYLYIQKVYFLWFSSWSQILWTFRRIFLLIVNTYKMSNTNLMKWAELPRKD